MPFLQLMRGAVHRLPRPRASYSDNAGRGERPRVPASGANQASAPGIGYGHGTAAKRVAFDGRRPFRNGGMCLPLWPGNVLDEAPCQTLMTARGGTGAPRT